MHNGPMRPMLATPTPTPGVPPQGEGWIHEIKWDGIRVMAATGPAGVRLTNRSGNDITAAYPEVVAGGAQLPDGLLLDGELIAIDREAGVPTLNAIAPRIHVRDPDKAARLAAERPATFMAFDVLRFDGHDVTALPLEQRRVLLEGLAPFGQAWELSQTFDDARAVTDFTRSSGLEGVMSKRASSRYQAGTRSVDWIKTPHRNELVAVIGGWVPMTGDDRQLGSVWVGHAHDEATFEADPVLYPLGRVGSGLGLTERDMLLTVLRGIERTDSPFSPLPTGPEVRRTRWVEPIVCVQVRYLSISSSGLMRQPVLRALRPDIRPVDAATAALTTPAPMA